MKILNLDDAIKAVTMLLDYEDDTDLIWSCDVINNLQNAPSVRDAEPVQKWISVKDRLPEKDGPYIVFGCSDAMKKFLPDYIPIWICDYSERNGGWYSIEMNRTIDYITHWMLLPGQPKEGDDEQTD